MPCGACKLNGHTAGLCPYLELRAEKVFQRAVELTTPLWNEPGRYAANKVVFSQFKIKDLVLLKKRLCNDLKQFIIDDRRFTFGYKHSLCICLATLFTTIYYIVSDEERHQLQSNPIINHPIVSRYVTPPMRIRAIRAIRAIPRKENIRLCFKNEEFAAPKDDCPICMNKITAKNVCKLNCGHMMCNKCVLNCAKLTDNLTCCICRARTIELTIPYKPLYDRLNNKYDSIVGLA
jgi:hypothetical protein